MSFTTKMFARMREVTRTLQKEGPAGATAAIQQALRERGMSGNGSAQKEWEKTLHDMKVMHDIPAELNTFKKAFQNQWGAASGGMGITDIEDVETIDEKNHEAAAAGEKGRFISDTFANAAGKRSYKLYIPSTYNSGQGNVTDRLPLIVMLHGCKQHPDDFAAGTGMNIVAEENRCLVLYPAQAKNANGSNCWNWFKLEDQQRDRGEPSIIADLTREITQTYNVDARRVYVAGLSAGGAMAAVMANTYPELYAAIGIHSGLPYRAAHDVPTAFAAMKSGKLSSRPISKSASGGSQSVSIPVIVFHGDHDHTVHAANGEQALAQALGDHRHRADATTYKDTMPGGHAYTRDMHRDNEGKVIAEHWTVHGAGHAWSGGSRKGSYTDPKGPDASKEMLRFFYTHSK